MLQLKNIEKDYAAGEMRVEALKGLNLAFRKNEFVAILGPSGCGKTTLLNIIGGLDRYTTGDLVINNRSTKEYKDADWDSYRNHSIGFVFQNYNLIPHQDVLSNVELALTLSGVSKTQRRKRAREALEKVGLGDQMHKKPNQMSGGQMQRVAIARAIVNDPDILLADEPTGALDTVTSVMVMDILKEISKEKLIIMVTHNPDLADKYATRIVRLLDGEVVDDTAPFTDAEMKKTGEKTTELTKKAKKQQKQEAKKAKTSMSFFTALSLSFNNLLTKKTRTLMTAFAGSIGIIGIALILALSTGVQAYIDSVQKDTLASYPVTITAEDDNIMSTIASLSVSMQSEDAAEHENNAVYSQSIMYNLFHSFGTEDGKTNNLTAFKKFLDKEINEDTSTTGLWKDVSSLQYQYDLHLNTYVQDADGTYRKTNISDAFDKADEEAAKAENPTAADNETEDGGTSDSASSGENDKNSATTTSAEKQAMKQMVKQRLSSYNLWTELLPGTDGQRISKMIYDQYDLLYGEWPTAANQIVLILDKNNEIPDIAFYALGEMDPQEVTDILNASAEGTEQSKETKKLDYAKVCGKSFKLLLDSDYYAKNSGGLWADIRQDATRMDMVLKNAYDLQIVGIIRPNADSSSQSLNGAFGYTHDLTDYAIHTARTTGIGEEQLKAENENFDVLSGLPFEKEAAVLTDAEKATEIQNYFSGLTDKQKTQLLTTMMADPPQGVLEQMLQESMAKYATREAMESLIAQSYNMDPETATSYLAAYTDQQLQDMMKEQFTEAIKKNYAENAQIKINALMGIDEDSTAALDPQQQAAGYAKAAAAFDAQMAAVTDQAAWAELYNKYMPSGVSDSTLKENLKKFGVVDEASPSSISLYVNTFESKDAIADIISAYNATAAEADQISYTDYVALLMSGITTIINAISYGLIAFVAISLVVSSIMIGIITYISVLERTKEIGILRSIGASKGDISHVFNAEALIIGFCAGAIGIGISLLLCIPINFIIHTLTQISTINATLMPQAAAVLVLISMLLTFIAGLIPASLAAKKDPVVALRTE